MIVLNGLVGISLLLGGLRYHEQTYNLYGANAFLAVLLPLAVLGLVLPDFTVSSPGPTLSPFQSVFLIVMSVGLYAVFLSIQTVRHREYFVSDGAPGACKSFGSPDGARARGAFLAVSRRAAAGLCAADRAAGQADRQADRLRDPCPACPGGLGGLLVAVLILLSRIHGRGPRRLNNRLQRLDQPRPRHRGEQYWPQPSRQF